MRHEAYVLFAGLETEVEDFGDDGALLVAHNLKRVKFHRKLPALGLEMGQGAQGEAFEEEVEVEGGGAGGGGEGAVLSKEADLEHGNDGHDGEAIEETLDHTKVVLESYTELRERNIFYLHALYLLLLILPLVINQLFLINLLAQLLYKCVAESEAHTCIHEASLVLYQLLFEAAAEGSSQHRQKVEHTLIC